MKLPEGYSLQSDPLDRLKAFGGAANVIACLVALLVYPFGLVWAFNVLFRFANIPYNFQTWAAAAVIVSLFVFPRVQR